MSLGEAVTGVFLLAYAGVAVLALRRRLLARLAVREAVRRPWQSALVVAGLTIGSAAIFCMQIVGDSAVDSVAAGANDAWGRVDLTVTDGQRPFSADLARMLAEDASVRSRVAAVQGGVELLGTLVDLDQETSGAARVIGFDPTTQDRFGMYVLEDGRQTDGRDLRPGEVLISRSLALTLGARTDDRVRISTSTSEDILLKVSGVARPEGPGAYGLRPAVYAPLAALGGILGPGTINIIRISAKGNGDAELTAAHEAAPLVRDALTELAAGSSLEVREAKAEDIEAVTRAQNDSRSWEMAYGLIVALAGVALIVNIIVVLAEERRRRLAVLRALGLSRSGIIALSVLEGAVYSLVGSAFGLVTGGLAALLMGGLFAGTLTGPSGRDVPVHLAIQPASAVFAVAGGCLIALGTVLATSIRTSRLAISSAIKDLPEPPATIRWSWRAISVLVAIGVASATAILIASLEVRLLAGVGLIAVVAALARGRISDRARATLAGGSITVWALSLSAAHPPGNTTEATSAWALALIASVFGLSLLFAANLRLLEPLVGFIAGSNSGTRAVLRPTIANLSRRPLLAGLGTGTFALVVAMLTFLVNVPGTYERYLAAAAGAYDIRVASVSKPGLELPAGIRPEVASEERISTRAYQGNVEWRNSDGSHSIDTDQLVTMYELSDAQLANPPVRLVGRDARFGTDQEVWRALREDPTLVAASNYGLGGTVTFDSRTGPVSRRIVATFSPAPLFGILGSSDATMPFEGTAAGTTILVGVRSGADVDSMSRQIRQALYPEGADVQRVRDLVTESIAGTRNFIQLLNVLFGMGVLIGVATVGIVALRAVIERRRSIGLLRALGYRPRTIAAGMLTEASLTATGGLTIGIAVGIATGYIYTLGAGVLPAASFAIDATALVKIVVLVYAAVLLVTIGPALQASRLRPAEALRFVD